MIQPCATRMQSNRFQKSAKYALTAPTASIRSTNSIVKATAKMHSSTRNGVGRPLAARMSPLSPSSAPSSAPRMAIVAQSATIRSITTLCTARARSSRTMSDRRSSIFRPRPVRGLLCRAASPALPERRRAI